MSDHRNDLWDRFALRLVARFPEQYGVPPTGYALNWAEDGSRFWITAMGSDEVLAEARYPGPGDVTLCGGD